MLDELQIFEDLEQGTPEWHAARCGVVTASEFSTVLMKGRGGAPSETRKKLMACKAAEILSGKPVQTFAGNAYTALGHELEPEIRALYESTCEHDVTQVGFMRRGRIGCSPDGVISDGQGLFEAKSCQPHIQIDRLLARVLPEEHKAQVMGQLLVSGRSYVDYVSYSPGLPELRVRVYRDLPYLSTLNQELQLFIRELDALVAQIKAMA
ncbi:YqaJ viral recombinase family protein [Xanthomonas citri pv. citri]